MDTVMLPHMTCSRNNFVTIDMCDNQIEGVDRWQTGVNGITKVLKGSRNSGILTHDHPVSSHTF